MFKTTTVTQVGSYAQFKTKRRSFVSKRRPATAALTGRAVDRRLLQSNPGDLMITRPESTFLLKVHGDSMKAAGIEDGALLVVDRSIRPVNHHLVIAVIGGAFTVKRLFKRGERVLLCPENSAYAAIEVNEKMDCKIWGVVIGCLPETHSS